MKDKDNRPPPIIIPTENQPKSIPIPPVPTTKDFPSFPKWPQK